jgi:hypothetical protein
VSSGGSSVSSETTMVTAKTIGTPISPEPIAGIHVAMASIPQPAPPLISPKLPSLNIGMNHTIRPTIMPESAPWRSRPPSRAWRKRNRSRAVRAGVRRSNSNSAPSVLSMSRRWLSFGVGSVITPTFYKEIPVVDPPVVRLPSKPLDREPFPTGPSLVELRESLLNERLEGI